MAGPRNDLPEFYGRVSVPLETHSGRPPFEGSRTALSCFLIPEGDSGGNDVTVEGLEKHTPLYYVADSSSPSLGIIFLFIKEAYCCVGVYGEGPED